MQTRPILYGFDGSSHVRTVRMVLAAKHVEYDQIPVNIFSGDLQEEEHLSRHPFGKIPVMDVDGLRLLETDAICRYLDETREGPSHIPGTPVGRARMTEAINLTNNYGYRALMGVAGYHLFPDFVGNPDGEQHADALASAATFLDLVMHKKGEDPWLAGRSVSLADFFLAPMWYFVSITPEYDRLRQIAGLSEWWARVRALDCFRDTEPAVY